MSAKKNINLDISQLSLKPANILGSVAVAQLSQTNSTFLTDIKKALSANHPVVFGAKIYSSFQSNQTRQNGVVPIPNTQTERLVGGHALMMVGYDDNVNHGMYEPIPYNPRTRQNKQLIKGYFTVRNSWGESWGDKGYFYIPYSFIANTDLSYGFYMLSKVSK